MGFQNEFASYEPLRRIVNSETVQALQKRLSVATINPIGAINGQLIDANTLNEIDNSILYVIAIDGSNLPTNQENGYPGAEIGYLTVSSVLIELDKIRNINKEKFPNPKALRETEKSTSFEGVLPGCNIIIDNEEDDKSSFRRVLFELLSKQRVFSDGETLLETYEYLFQSRINSTGDKPKSPISGYENEEMTYGCGTYSCPHSGKDLFSTDALRLHELMNPVGSSGEMYNQTMSVIEKLTLVNILRNFERKGWLRDLRHTAFIIDGPLAVFSVSAWLSNAISKELERINTEQKKLTNLDMLLCGIEKTGLFVNHFEQLDTFKNESGQENFKARSILLLDDNYIKTHIKPSTSKKPYGSETYFGRKVFYKTKMGYRVVAVLGCFNDYQRNLYTCNINQFARLKDITKLLDELSSNRYQNSITALISAHTEAAIPLNLGKKIFEERLRVLNNNGSPNV